MTPTVFSSAVAARAFALAGSAVFTITSRRSGDHYTFRLSRAEDDAGDPQDRWFASVETGYRDFVYIGMVSGAPLALRTTRASKLTAEAPSFKALAWFVRRVLAQPGDDLPTDAEVRHEGRCGRCGRELTHPQSIDLGIGPECIKHVGAAALDFGVRLDRAA